MHHSILFEWQADTDGNMYKEHTNQNTHFINNICYHNTKQNQWFDQWKW